MKRRKAKPTRHFVIAAVKVEQGSGLDADGHRTTPVLRLELRGRWTHGQDQTINALIEAETAPVLAELILRACPPPPPSTPELDATVA